MGPVTRTENPGFVDTLLQSAPETGEFDLVHTLAEPLPAWVITEMMGVPMQDRNRFIDWSHRLIGATQVTDPDRVARASVAEQEMTVYLRRLVEEKRTCPAGDFISILASAQAGGEKITDAEIIATCILLLTAGHETTTRLIGNATLLLLQHPAQLSDVRRDLNLIDAVIEESLRFDPPVQMTLRFVKTTFEFAGHRFKKGQMVMLNFAAANRDPRTTTDPATFNIHRDKFQHVAFGHGIHLCLGMALARLEARVALTTLLTRYPTLEYLKTGSPAWQGNPFFRGLDNLTVYGSAIGR